mmetsp:Transcript_36204/g.107543  ORF Transcript_36204/g.107543 Transcript_36204/m.107543 type:complete len:246 (+) Transcript_36204:180-917(+)
MPRHANRWSEPGRSRRRGRRSPRREAWWAPTRGCWAWAWRWGPRLWPPRPWPPRPWPPRPWPPRPWPPRRRVAPWLPRRRCPALALSGARPCGPSFPSQPRSTAWRRTARPRSSTGRCGHSRQPCHRRPRPRRLRRAAAPWRERPRCCWARPRRATSPPHRPAATAASRRRPSCRDSPRAPCKRARSQPCSRPGRTSGSSGAPSWPRRRSPPLRTCDSRSCQARKKTSSRPWTCGRGCVLPPSFS